MSWNLINIGELCEIKHGFAFKSAYFAGSGEYILLSPGNFEIKGGLKLKGDKEKYYQGDIPDGFILSEGDLLVVMTDLMQNAPILGGAAIVPENNRFLHNQRLGKIIDININLVDGRYLYYCLNNEAYRSQVRASASGATVRHTSPDRIRKCKLPLPPLPTQRRIAEILSAYDDLIENNRRRIRLLEEAARLLYREWFVHFRFPGHEQAQWYTDEQGRRLPVGWRWDALGNVCNVIMGQSPSSEFYNDDKQGLPFHQGVTNFGDRFVTHKTFCSIDSRIAQKGDILCSVRAPVGRLNITLDKIIVGRGLAAIHNKCGFQSFQYYQLCNHFVQEDMIGGGSIFNSVTKKELESQLMLVPESCVASNFETSASIIDKQIENLHSKNILLVEARDLLLPRLMSGRLPV
jgi:type I restriction enzyme S subunit